MGDQLLSTATSGAVIRYAASLGYDLTQADVIEIKKGSVVRFYGSKETIAEAVDDFLDAYER
jgi:hypothetical protein